MSFLRLHHRNGRRRHSAQFQRFLQVLFGQVVHRHKVFLAVHFHRRRQLETDIFLYRCVTFLAFSIFLCYTGLSRKARAFSALLGFENRVSAFLLLFYLPVVIKDQKITIRSANLVHIEFVSLLCVSIRVYDHSLIDFRPADRDRCCKHISITSSSFPIFSISDLLTVLNHLWHSSDGALFHWAISMSYSCLCAFLSKFDCSKSGTFNFSTDTFKIFKNVICIFFWRLSIRNFFSCNLRNRLHFFKLVKIIVQLFF